LRNSESALTQPLHRIDQIDRDLACVAEAWPKLSEPVKDAILALVESSKKKKRR
jgi:hypothetical protein